MNKVALFLVVMTLLSVAVSYSQTNDNNELSAIKSAAMDYVEGWYQGDAERMAKSLHPDLVKRTVRELSKTTLVEYTRAGGGKDTAKDKLFYEVDVLDVYKGIATVKGVSANYVDYLHLAKWNGKWLLVNILWDNRK